MIIFKNKVILDTSEMQSRACNVVIVFLLIISFATINFAYGQIEIFPTPDDFIFKGHSLIIDIESEETGTIPIIIQVKDDLGNDRDMETFDVGFDSSWGKHRIVLVPIIGVESSGDGIVQAKTNYKIHIQDANNPQTEHIVIFHTSHATDITSGIQETFSTVLDCPDVDGDGTPDEDGDAICDAWEANNNLIINDSSLLPGTYSIDCFLTHDGGCGNDLPDIFVEVDWIESHKPDPKALELVKIAFLKNNIRLHIQVDSKPAYDHLQEIVFPGDDSGPDPKGFDQLKSSQFGTEEERNSADWANEKNLKHQVFHYTLFAHRDGTIYGKTGTGEVLGNDFLITLGTYVGQVGSEDQQAGTFMHELGHNLGLHHGGAWDDTVNNKPNLFSVMTYVRQFSDLDANRNLDYSGQKLGHHHNTDVPQNLWAQASDWALDETEIKGYSKGLWLYTGHETEPIIFSCPDNQFYSSEWLTGAKGGVDWDCDGDPEEPPGKIPLNINNFPSDPTPPDEFLAGHNDWAALDFYFKDYADYADGTHTRVVNNEITIEGTTLDRISNLLALYRQIEMFDESDFTHGFSVPFVPITFSDSVVPPTQLQFTFDLQKDSLNNALAMVRDFLIPPIYADHLTVSVSLPVGSAAPGCETTSECFIPDTVTIDVGSEVTWSNDDTAAHTVTFGSVADGPSGVFDSSLFMAGTTVSHTFDAEGDYPYFCMVHPWMVGLVVVGDISGPGPDEPFKDSFKVAIRSAIDSINVHNISEAKETVQQIDTSLQASLSHNYLKVQPITTNLIGTYEKALGFGFVATGQELSPPIVTSQKIDQMIQDVENFVADIKSQKPYCGVPFELDHGQCVCPQGKNENSEGDCVNKPPRVQWPDFVLANEVQCNDGLELVITLNGKPACVSPSHVAPLISYGYAVE